MYKLEMVQGWNPIANGGASGFFKGSFDGRNHSISGLNIDRSSSNGVGLFGYAQDATIKNLHINSAFLVGDSRVGALVGQANGPNMTIKNCSAQNVVTIGLRYRMGGLIGDAEGATILDSFAKDITTNVTAANMYTGGLVGRADNAHIENSYVEKANIWGRQTAAGLVARAQNAVIKNCEAREVIVRGDHTLAGLLGNGEDANVSDSYASGIVYDPDTIRTTWDGRIRANYIGPLIGRTNAGTDITNSSYDVQVVIETPPSSD